MSSNERIKTSSRNPASNAQDAREQNRISYRAPASFDPASFKYGKPAGLTSSNDATHPRQASHGDIDNKTSTLSQAGHHTGLPATRQYRPLIPGGEDSRQRHSALTDAQAAPPPVFADAINDASADFDAPAGQIEVEEGEEGRIPQPFSRQSLEVIPEEHESTVGTSPPVASAGRHVRKEEVLSTEDSKREERTPAKRRNLRAGRKIPIDQNEAEEPTQQSTTRFDPVTLKILPSPLPKVTPLKASRPGAGQISRSEGGHLPSPMLSRLSGRLPKDTLVPASMSPQATTRKETENAIKMIEEQLPDTRPRLTGKKRKSILSLDQGDSARSLDGSAASSSGSRTPAEERPSESPAESSVLVKRTRLTGHEDTTIDSPSISGFKASRRTEASDPSKSTSVVETSRGTVAGPASVEKPASQRSTLAGRPKAKNLQMSKPAMTAPVASSSAPHMQKLSPFMEPVAASISSTPRQQSTDSSTATSRRSRSPIDFKHDDASGLINGVMSLVCHQFVPFTGALLAHDVLLSVLRLRSDGFVS